jgi:chromosome segregation ATPase
MDKLQTHFASIKDDLEGKIAYMSSRLLEAEERLKAASDAGKAWEAKHTAWLSEREELMVNKVTTEDTMAKLNMELETLRESAGATEESQLEKLCQVSAEAEGLRRRVREMQELKMRLAAAEKEGKLSLIFPCTCCIQPYPLLSQSCSWPLEGRRF